MSTLTPEEAAEIRSRAMDMMKSERELGEKYPLSLKITHIENFPKMDVNKKGDFFVVATINDGPKHKSSVKVASSSARMLAFHETISLGEVSLSDILTLRLSDYDKFSKNDLVGRTHLSIAALIQETEHELLLEDDDNSIAHDGRIATTLHISAEGIPDSWKHLQVTPLETTSFPKHIMMITRGTRGDVQPFIALARGLAEKCNYLITIVSELPYHDRILTQTSVKAGAIQFRCSGGDTTTKVDTKLSKWAMNTTSEVMQMAMLGRAEREFFPSEPAIYHWAKTMKPDALCYGFTMANIAMIASEVLGIPLIGFVLQPSCIPSKSYQPVIPIDTHGFGLIDSIESKMVTTGMQQGIKKLMENNIFDPFLKKMRAGRGLPSLNKDCWEVLKEQDSAILVPINPVLFGGKPPDWSEHSVLSECIFLQGGSVPELADDMSAFIQAGKDANAPVIVMAFSSMPIPRESILKISAKIVKECKHKPRMIALMGPHANEKISSKLDAEIKKLTAENLIFEAAGAPFGNLFPKLDAIVIHGGLGTTAEALRVGVPTMVCGVLLMDQRFWGKRVNDLGCGPEPVHISMFEKQCVKSMDELLEPGSDFAKAAKELAPQIQSEGDGSGVDENIKAFNDLLATAQPFKSSY
jgi:sterol 3beta-glucosyltransferase